MSRDSKRRVRRAAKPKAKSKPKPRIVHYWKCKELGKNQLGIECPHCGEKTVVNMRHWLIRDRTFTSRGCTYCDWFATIPLDQLPIRDPRREDYA